MIAHIHSGQRDSYTVDAPGNTAYHIVKRRGCMPLIVQKRHCINPQHTVFVNRDIRWTADAGFSTALADDIYVGGTPVYSNVSVSISTSGDVTVVMADGDHAIFIEFGAGAYYNGAAKDSPHPLGKQLGFTIGEYGKGRGKQQAWDLPGSNLKQPKLSHGTPAAMPMYHGVQDAVAQLESIAKKVFGN